MTGDGRTIPDGRYTAVVDRFEERDPAGGDATAGRKLAVLLLESGESVVAERAVPAWRLPEDARRRDAVLEVVVRNGFVTSFEFDRETTGQRTADAQARFDRLAERPDEDEGAGDEDKEIRDENEGTRNEDEEIQDES